MLLRCSTDRVRTGRGGGGSEALPERRRPKMGRGGGLGWMSWVPQNLWLKTISTEH